MEYVVDTILLLTLLAVATYKTVKFLNYYGIPTHTRDLLIDHKY